MLKGPLLNRDRWEDLRTFNLTGVAGIDGAQWDFESLALLLVLTRDRLVIQELQSVRSNVTKYILTSQTDPSKI